jgi:signal transduction histidine kinase
MPNLEIQQEKTSSPVFLPTEVQTILDRLSEVNRLLKRKIFDFYTIFEISRQLNSTLDLNELLENILSACLSQLSPKWVMVFCQKESKDKKLSLVRSKGEICSAEGVRLGQTSAQEAKMTLDLNPCFISLLKESNRPLFVDDIEKESGFSAWEKRKWSRLKRFGAELLVPLVLKEELIGVLLLAKKISDSLYFENDLEFLELLSNQAAVAVENALLYQSEKNANYELRKTQKQLIQTEKLAALGKLSASIAHEINNPLGIIKNYLEILSRKLKGRSTQKDIQIIKEEIDRIAKILYQLLEFHRPRLKKPISVDLVSLLTHTINLVEKQFKNKNIFLVENFPDKVSEIYGHPEELKQVFLNLLLNSKDFMPRGGEISVSLSENEGEIEIEFSDTGSGIPHKNKNKIFEPFFTTKADGKGLGLGLWVCYGIIERHQGSITSEKKEGRGATFLIRLPISLKTLSRWSG